MSLVRTQLSQYRVWASLVRSLGLERRSDGAEPSTLITQDILGKKNGSIPLIDSGEYLRG